MVNRLLPLLLLFTFTLPTDANATYSICREISAELTLAKDDLQITSEEIRELYEKCLTVEAWGTYD